MFKLLKFLRDCLLTKKEIKQIIPEGTPRPLVKKGSLADISNFCDEIRKDLWIKKKTDDRLYVEMGNLKDKVERFIETRKGHKR